MLGCLAEGCLETVGVWFGGAVFAFAGFYVMITAGGSEQPLLAYALGVLCLHTAGMLLVGFGLKKATRLWAVSWVLALVAFLVVAAIVGRRP